MAIDPWASIESRSGFKATPEADKPQIRLKSKPATLTAGKAQTNPPSLNSYGATSEKAESANVLWRMSVHFEEVCDAP